eukprot:TRINITY_DN37610_c0_g1_i1.p1 TRINITY_DN37610_c0_g1~~TRINITY_DN37610_c0_g1_i1.p1  ORF type:complete len:286 (-),score=25.54 TRINITY_DN37610_c0_g1_i1:201-998(-)
MARGVHAVQVLDEDRPFWQFACSKLEDVAQGLFAESWRDEFSWMPEDVRQSIMDTFAHAAEIDLDKTRSYPHRWTFSSDDGSMVVWKSDYDPRDCPRRAAQVDDTWPGCSTILVVQASVVKAFASRTQEEMGEYKFAGHASVRDVRRSVARSLESNAADLHFMDEAGQTMGHRTLIKEQMSCVDSANEKVLYFQCSFAYSLQTTCIRDPPVDAPLGSLLGPDMGWFRLATHRQGGSGRKFVISCHLVNEGGAGAACVVCTRAAGE